MNKKKGFTLIELLVVVLIIGILAAIALPQYQKSVRKTRIAEARVNLKSIADGLELYILSNGNYTQDIADLDIQVNTESKDWSYYVDECTVTLDNKIGCSIIAQPKFENLSYDIELGTRNYDSDWAGKFVCWFSDEDSSAEKICKTLGKREVSQGYILLE